MSSTIVPVKIPASPIFANSTVKLCPADLMGILLRAYASAS